MITIFKLAIFAFFAIPLVSQAQRAGDLDKSFNYGQGSNYEFDRTVGANKRICFHAIQLDGKIVIGGDFQYYNDSNANRIARLNEDGSLDSSFNPVSGADSTIGAICIQNDGKIIIGGRFSVFNGISRTRIARINSNGSLDTTFNPGIGANSDIYSINVQSDGKIIIGGTFNSYNAITKNYVARLNPNGSLDNSFNIGTGADDKILATQIQNDGKILIAGDFTSFNNINQNRIARLNTDGSLDRTFNIGSGFDRFIRTISIQDNGKIIVGGGFTTFNSLAKSHLARLNTNGSIDNTFNISDEINDGVNTISIQTDGKIIIGGFFTTVNNLARNHIARLLADGNIDTSFDSGFGTSSSTFNITSSSIQSNGRILIGGDFDHFNDLRTPFIARLIDTINTTSNNSKVNTEKLKIYPNPADNQVFITASSPKLVQIINSLGQVILSKKADNTTSISTSTLPSGIYKVSVEGYKPSSLVISK